MRTTKQPRPRRAYNPSTGVLERRRVAVRDQSASRYSSPIESHFCALCWRQTEAAMVDERPRIYARRTAHQYAEVECTTAIRAAAAKYATALTKRYIAILNGSEGPYGLGNIASYFTVAELDGDTSPESFRDHVERRERWRLMAKTGNVLGVAISPGIDGKDVKPSRRYCSEHNPRRSIAARRRYQLDRVRQLEFEQAIFAIGAEQSHRFRRWRSEDHADIRRMAYERVYNKPTLELIRELERQGITRRADIARRIGISRQAVYAAIKAGTPSRRSRRLASATE